jgi:hypothetical protein
MSRTNAGLARAEVSRARIREAIPRHLDERGRLRVTSLAEELGLCKATVSQHLAKMPGVPPNRTRVDNLRDLGLARSARARAPILAACADPANCLPDGRPVGVRVAAALGWRPQRLSNLMRYWPDGPNFAREPARSRPPRGPRPSKSPGPARGPEPERVPDDIEARIAAAMAEKRRAIEAGQLNDDRRQRA